MYILQTRNNKSERPAHVWGNGIWIGTSFSDASATPNIDILY